MTRPPFELSLKDRVFLANQLKILECIYPDDADHYSNWRTAIERGYTLHYEDGTQWFYDEMSIEECREVRAILDMFVDLKYSYEKLSDKTGITPSNVTFMGFSGNEETRQLGYAAYLINDLHLWEPLKGSGDNLNSHFPTLEAYCRMLKVYQPYRKGNQLTKEQIQEIVAAATHPSNR